ncbi:MAG TPA: septal ring lytic transglycosylase RlpA family protein [Rubrobacter sp.]|nr:septal ring lytic transglycosylase RlpA family protein [Rubrobacter sp.]
MLRLFSRLLWLVVLVGVFVAFDNGKAEADTGLTSWYGPGFEGALTASGEVFDPYGYTAAHKTLPLGTQLSVSYAGRTVQVTVNDRGPYSGGRDLDLSQGAAEYLGLTSAGVDWVDYYVVGGGGYAADTGYEDASYTADSDGETYAPDRADSGGGGSYVVQSGDTLSGIAAELGTSVEELAADNGITDVDFLSVGQTLYY